MYAGALGCSDSPLHTAKTRWQGNCIVPIYDDVIMTVLHHRTISCSLKQQWNSSEPFFSSLQCSGTLSLSCLGIRSVSTSHGTLTLKGIMCSFFTENRPTVGNPSFFLPLLKHTEGNPSDLLPWLKHAKGAEVLLIFRVTSLAQQKSSLSNTTHFQSTKTQNSTETLDNCLKKIKKSI